MTELSLKTTHLARCENCDWRDFSEQGQRLSHQHARDHQHRTVYLALRRVDYDFRTVSPEDWDAHPTKDERPPLPKK